MTKHYVHINSTHRQGHESKSNFTVFLNPPIQNCWRSALSVLTTSNTFYNIKEGVNDKIFWVERTDTYNPTTQVLVSSASREFYNIIQPGYHSLERLTILVSNALSENPVYQVGGNDTKTYTRQVGAGNAIATYSVNTNEDFTTSIIGRQAGNQQKFWSILYRSMDPDFPDTFEQTPWHLLGIKQSQAYAVIALANTSGTPLNETDNTETDRTLISTGVSRESHPYFYVYSKTLGTNSRQTQKSIGNTIGTINSHHFATIPINVNRYSWIHHNLTDTNFEWHELNGTLSSFDIQILDESLYEFADDAHDNFTCTIIIETHEPKNEIQERNTLLFNKQGYRFAHPC